MPSMERKQEYFDKMMGMIDQFNKIFLVGADNVGSLQMQQIRIALRGSGEMLMGKNTLMKKCIRMYLKDHPGHPIEAMMPKLVGNVGFVFTNKDLAEVRDIIEANKVPAAAKAGSIAPVNVVVPPGPTGCDPGQTSFFQALQIATKIVKGQIEIISDVKLITIGEKVGSSEAALLQKLNIKPFSYGLIIQQVYDDGSLFDPAVLDLTDDDLANKFSAGVTKIAAIGLAIGYPTLATLRHSICNGFKKLVAVAIETEYTFDQAQPILDYLADPAAWAAANGGAVAEEAVEEEAAPVEEEESSDDGGGMDMFGGDDY